MDRERRSAEADGKENQAPWGAEPPIDECLAAVKGTPSGAALAQQVQREPASPSKWVALVQHECDRTHANDPASSGSAPSRSALLPLYKAAIRNARPESNTESSASLWLGYARELARTNLDDAADVFARCKLDRACTSSAAFWRDFCELEVKLGRPRKACDRLEQGVKHSALSRDEADRRIASIMPLYHQPSSAGKRSKLGIASKLGHPSRVRATPDQQHDPSSTGLSSSSSLSGTAGLQPAQVSHTPSGGDDAGTSARHELSVDSNLAPVYEPQTPSGDGPVNTQSGDRSQQRQPSQKHDTHGASATITTASALSSSRHREHEQRSHQRSESEEPQAGLSESKQQHHAASAPPVGQQECSHTEDRDQGLEEQRTRDQAHRPSASHSAVAERNECNGTRSDREKQHRRYDQLKDQAQNRREDAQLQHQDLGGCDRGAADDSGRGNSAAQHAHKQRDHQAQQQSDQNQQQQQQQQQQTRAKETDKYVQLGNRVYTKLSVVGTGGTSKVYKTVSNSRMYALKRVKMHGLCEEAKKGLEDEVNLLKRLRGRRNIIQLVDCEVDKSSGIVYMVLEYGEIDLAVLLAQREEWQRKRGSSPNDVVSSSCAPAAAAMRRGDNFVRLYFEEMVEAVGAIHQERIVHSDLKPANFMSVSGTLKLIDFGIARAISQPSHEPTNIVREQQVGTLNYMSPEAVLNGSATGPNGQSLKVGRASDIWSLGCILYRMVYGTTPFDHIKGIIQKMQAITDLSHGVEFPEIAGLPADAHLVHLMNGCLAKNPSERLSIQSILSHPFLLPPVSPSITQPSLERVLHQVLDHSRDRYNMQDSKQGQLHKQLAAEAMRQLAWPSDRRNSDLGEGGSSPTHQQEQPQDPATEDGRVLDLRPLLRTANPQGRHDGQMRDRSG
jgi:serine/threonine-protein kinase TTK/MPS1